MSMPRERELIEVSASPSPSHLLPMATKPHEDELFSSWVSRLADRHGFSPITFSHILLKRQFRPHMAAFDSSPPDWFIEAVAPQVGVSVARLRRTGLATPRGIGDSWMLGFGRVPGTEQAGWLQFCPTCLHEDKTPYFRRRWRLVAVSCCIRHARVLVDRCPICGQQIDMNRALPECCGVRFAAAPSIEASPLSLLVQRKFEETLSALEDEHGFEACLPLLRDQAEVMKRRAGANGIPQLRAFDMHPIERHVAMLGTLPIPSGRRIVSAHRTWLQDCGLASIAAAAEHRRGLMRQRADRVKVVPHGHTGKKRKRPPGKQKLATNKAPDPGTISKVILNAPAKWGVRLELQQLDAVRTPLFTAYWAEIFERLSRPR